ncbi:hypothetical protein [Anaeromusa sp.]|uniref:hypothetical protein n=1 Tax=Anaeromusa sp. TaxID=1872520 RepID=UPI00260220EC|nr:hypothetical protein [Anaeromusa sp.]MDD3157474.1 hypothetical protein [Anaeromusa sp.]
MTELIPASHNLPATIEDLAKFILVGREKLVSVRAEIRAINKLELAEEVRTQKRNEAQMLSEALLDAEVRIGELLKQIPKAAGFRSDLQPKDTNVPRLTAVKSEKPKAEAIQDLGFTEKQKQRFETLASNKDVVEQVKAEARENDDLPTRSRVLQLVKQKNAPPPKEENYEFRYQAARSINEAISAACLVKVSQEHLQAWHESLTVKGEGAFQLDMVNEALENLRVIKAFLSRKEHQK